MTSIRMSSLNKGTFQLTIKRRQSKTLRRSLLWTEGPSSDSSIALGSRALGDKQPTIKTLSHTVQFFSFFSKEDVDSVTYSWPTDCRQGSRLHAVCTDRPPLVLTCQSRCESKSRYVVERMWKCRLLLLTGLLVRPKKVNNTAVMSERAQQARFLYYRGSCSWPSIWLIIFTFN